ncbi:hypothetical protein [Methanocella arvoryzae]|uniref:Uncharacterized protein n=1 Tax=Methanocella arvoryzae (strain DSM 22066 / NBRC 105507 / MRE50) TaxID=351160 RepID=Q0W328_METAR|nr:hypothetical protein [Methanocella arvoryzae]CAJ37215.1 hypothetical protein RCIX2075 [Methanocella arvoryzae MRE50]
MIGCVTIPAVKKSSAATGTAPKKAAPEKVASKPVKRAAASKKAAAIKAPSKATVSKKAVAKKAPVKAPAKAAPKAPAAKKAPAKAPARAPAVKKAPVKAAAKSPAAKKTAPKAKAAKSEGKTVNDLITPRPMEVKSMDELLGIKKFEDTRNKPIIPGKFDLILPPGTPRKLILTLAKEFDVELVTRTDIYVPIGISDIQRELLAIRGDKKTIKKFEKIVLEKLAEIAADTTGPNASYDERMKASKAVKKPAAKKASKASA